MNTMTTTDATFDAATAGRARRMGRTLRKRLAVLMATTAMMTGGVVAAAPSHASNLIYAYQSWTVSKYTFAAQQTYYTCGPASTRLALTSRGVYLSEATLAKDLGTTVDGTDNIGLVTNVLNRRANTQWYETKWIPGSWTSSNRQLLMEDVVRDVNLDFVVVANVVGTQVDTSGRSHTYSGGHYLTIVGYSNYGNTAVIEDVALTSGHKYSMTIDRLTDWIANRGYSA